MNEVKEELCDISGDNEAQDVDRKPVICNWCSDDFNNQGLTIKTEEFCIKDEVVDVGLNEFNADIQSNLYCFECDYSTFSKRMLIEHLKSHKDDCNIKTQSKCKSLLKRNTCQHTSEKRFKCNICEYSSTWAMNLKRYMNKHCVERPYKCSVCDYSTVYSNNLKRHALVRHSHEKQFKCTVCDYSTAHSNNLKRHALIRHCHEKPYKCGICDYSTIYANCLKSHTLRHIRKKSYICNVSNYSCVKPGNLKQHMHTQTD